ncbi:MAG: hypothetical protein ACYDH8_07285 [Syntrophales bacterium]
MNSFACRLFNVFFLVLALTACAAIPPYKPLSPQSGVACPGIFPPKAFRVVHQIDIKSALIGKGVFIGAAKVDPQNNALHAVLMSAEGMVLFEAEYENGDIKIISAFPPLNDLAFAKRLMADVLFVLLKPSGGPVEQGVDGQGLAACRWMGGADTVLETTLRSDGAVRMRLYGGDRRVVKEALAWPPFDRGMPTRISLKGFSPSKYTIELMLIEMEFVD